MVSPVKSTATGQWKRIVQPKDCLLIMKMRMRESANGFRAQVAIGEDENAMAGGSLLDLCAHGFERSAGRDVDGEVGWSRVGQIAQHGFAIHQDSAALAAVIVVDVDDAKSWPRFAERECDGIAGVDMALVGKGLADDDGVGIAKLGEDFSGRAPR